MATSRKVNNPNTNKEETFLQTTDNVTTIAPKHTLAQSQDSDVCSSFRRTEVIGRGKFGVVYKGYHVKTQQVYAIKVLNLDSESDEVEDVQREVQFLSSLKQFPNIIRYFGSYLKDTNLWIIMDYCAGGSIRTLLRPGKIDEKYIGIIMREILIALQYIHKDNVIHRDIKAANVLVTNEGKVKLCDFGVAAQLNQTKLRRQTMAGTPYWMAPEVIMEGAYYDTKADIWSLGITAYEIATGNPPYCEIEALRAMQLITKSKPARLEGRSYSTSLKEFIALCLDEDPKERLSAEELQKTKFIKSQRAVPTTILKELISRYLLFRDKHTPREHSYADDLGNNKESEVNYKNQDVAVAEPATDAKPDDMDVKWDFDSLTSTDYIMENDINVDIIPEENSNDWSKTEGDQFNFAYPDEDPYYFGHTNNNNTHHIRKTYQESTMGKQYHATFMKNSTLNAYNGQTHTTTNNFTSNLQRTGLGNNGMMGTHATHTTANKATESRATKQLLQLFEDSDVITEERSIDNDIYNIQKPHSLVPPQDLQSNGVTNPPSSILRPQLNMINGPNIASHSTQSLPVLQTKFSKNMTGPGNVVTSAATPIEIEIPEELPVSSIKVPSNLDTPIETKTRSATVSASNLNHTNHPNLYRRLTVTGNNNNASAPVINRKDSQLGKGHSDDPSNFSKVHRRTPTPPNNSVTSSNQSPAKMLTASPNGNSSSIYHSSFKSAPIPLIESKDSFVQSANNGASLGTSLEGETSRVKRDFKLNNPNLKLHMPSPTNITSNKLLVNTTQIGDSPGIGGENINQFGFNTTSTANIPVSMTPINEKHMDFGSKIKRSQSLSKVKSSTIHDNTGTPGVVNRSKKPSSNTTNSIGSIGSEQAESTTLSNESQLNSSSTAGSHVALNQSLSNIYNSATSVWNGNSNNLSGANPKLCMSMPPVSIPTELFLDFDLKNPSNKNEYVWQDQKTRVLDELKSLLTLFDDNLLVLESSLKKQLHSVEKAIPSNTSMQLTAVASHPEMEEEANEAGTPETINNLSNEQEASL
ncbi:hypothetical protein TPHA_0H01630 [Tetrapisispora phaffii CBS 4417]|uniref:non-specific serine/threonine protein kinase n=1 Tax=Tetrapisispora phaffii (strain ATCC 24235 / CBS 4417 / NBRC 1672 / NRRL Y-8282 / UCD 70-5) TaxID=1071381 RepID=G8BX65_TETPH|nr:hypothetical protein TPHA_0H01630 [Tetrapisispora phaffii CBS 4417]CCE64369.1 hypothetical protein TPHA_0H01630 [Tetrapisispora phaffii CBS 4417]